MAKSPAPQDPVDGTDEPAGLAPELEDFVAAEKVQGRTIAIMVLIAIVLVGAAGGAWFVFGEKLLRDPVQDIPVVRADPRPYKVLPEHPGGMQIPDRDKLVYERLQTAEDGAESAAPKVEQLLPPAEKPKALPEDERTTLARMALIQGVAAVIASGLGVFGVTPVEELR